MKVLIVEDDPLHRSYLHEAVNAALPECDTVIEAENGTVGEKLARDHKSAHIVMDLQMASRNGIEAARTIWKERPETRILFWSNYSDEAYVRGVSRIVPDGAAYGYVLKSASDERLKLALRSIFVESQCVIDREVRGLQQKSLGQTNGFTDSEYEILVDIALGLSIDKSYEDSNELIQNLSQSKELAACFDSFFQQYAYGTLSCETQALTPGTSIHEYILNLISTDRFIKRI